MIDKMPKHKKENKSVAKKSKTNTKAIKMLYNKQMDRLIFY